MLKPTDKQMLLSGVGLGAWLNIWPAAISPWAPFIFAYILLFIAFGAFVWDKRDAK